MTTQEEFFQTHAVDGVLTDAQMVQMMNLPEGDSGAKVPQGEVPDLTPAPTPAPTTVDEPTKTPEPTAAPVPEATQPPVILAKDGVHTIPYEKLETARAAEKAAKAQAEAAAAEVERLRQENEALKSTPNPTPAPTAAPAAVNLADFGDFSDEAVAKGIEKLVSERVAATVADAVSKALAPLERRAAEDAAAKHWTTLLTAHPNMDSMLESQQFASWKASQPSFAQAAIDAVLDKGTTEQVVELLDTFVKVTGTTAATPTPAPTTAPVDPQAAAKAAIDKAGAKPPSSLTEVPGGAAHHDEAEAMLEMSPMALMSKFAGKTPEQIEALMRKTV